MRERPDAFDRRELGAVRGEKQQRQNVSVPAEERRQRHGVVVFGVVHNDEHALASRAMPQQSLEEGLEGFAIEDAAHGPDKLAAAQAHRTEARHGLARRRVL